MTRQEFYQFLKDARGIYPGDECQACNGIGTRVYGNTSGWRGGIGGAMMTTDVCDKCWGSGDKTRPWTNIRALEAKRADWEEDQVIEYLQRRLGLSFDNFKFAWAELQRYADKQERKRKLPEGAPVDAFWWAHTWHAVSNTIGKLLSHERRSNTTG